MGSSPSSGAYKPGYKPPPVPMASPTPSVGSATGTTTSPGRPSTASPRPSLPFLEKYSKKNKSGAATPPAPSASGSQMQQNGYGANGTTAPSSTSLSGSPLTSSPTTPTGPGQSLNGYPSHPHQQQQHYNQQPPAKDYFSRTATGPMGEDRFGQSPPAGSIYGGYQQERQSQPRSKTPNGYDEYNGRARTPNQMDVYSTSPNGSRSSQQPALPQKSNARAPSVASAHGLGISQGSSGGMEGLRNGMRSPVGERSMGRERSNSNASKMSGGGGSVSSGGRFGEDPATAPLPSLNGSSGNGAPMDHRHLRDRSNTVHSERSVRSDRSGRREEESASSRSRYPDQASSQQQQGSGSSRSREGSSRTPDMASSSSSRMMGRDNSSSSLSYNKNPSPPTSPEDVRTSEQTMPDTRSRSKPSYRPPTPPDASSPVPSSRGRRPSRKPSGDQFDALMDNLMQDISDLSTTPGSGVRDSSRPASAHRSRSRPNLRSESGRETNGSPPPTPGLPLMGGSNSNGNSNNGTNGSGSSSLRSYRGERSERSERDRERGERERGGEREYRSERTDRERDRERRERERAERAERDRGDRGERAERGERDRDREREREHRSDRGERERERERDRERGRSYDASKVSSSGRSSTRSRSTNRRGGTTHCEGCKHDIEPHEVEKVIKMQMGDFHPECFKCQRCRRPIESPRAAHEHDGRLLCEKDYARVLEKEAQRAQRRAPAVCAGCEQPIQSNEQPVYALGQAWHEHHLACHHCHNPIDRAVGHVEKNQRVYCPKDFGQLFLPKCRACNLPVEKEAVCAQDGKLKGKWHAACFGCQTCKKPFPDKSFYVYGDAPYCRRHYHKLNNSLCKGCDQPIEGPCAQTMEGWRFHPNCFSCVECKTPLSDVYYNFENQAYCERDILIIQKTRNVRAERRKTFFGKV
ncbi:hypothetical protein DFQ27_003221 [Actinomortierella ambigua]|uniref:LIM zinc-binding domain-containing protein n=1 Tax=Actinomortierella ambigua TaxID=1343610 RepID=A0A9P6Q7F4_9FUNG|nr:hypothetical protein DFQ27_003221 [Actinomortierella ambigua]